jgi:hypothetical protein
VQDPSGGWRKRSGRCPEDWLDERAANNAAIAAMAAHVKELEEEAAEAARRAAAERTVRALAHDWLSWLEEVWGAKPSTVKDYRFLLREPGEPFKRSSGVSPGRIMKAFGDRPADEVTPAEVSRFLRELDKEGLTPRNVNKHREVLQSIFTYGCRADTFELATNPVVGTDKRRQAPPAALDYYEVEEVEALARTCEQGGQREPRGIFDAAELEARHQEDRQDAEASGCSSTPACGSGRSSCCAGATSTSTAGCCSFAAASQPAWRDCRRVVARGWCRSRCPRPRCMLSRDSARARISRALRTMSWSTASVAGSMPQLFGAATSGGARPPACDRCVCTGCDTPPAVSSHVPPTPSSSATSWVIGSSRRPIAT